MPLFDRSTEEISHTLLAFRLEPLREVPSSTIRFSKGVGRILPTMHIPTENDAKVSLVQKLVYCSIWIYFT